MTRKAVMSFLDEELLPASGVRRKPALDENLLDSGILDSLGIMKLLEYLERTFSISVDEEDLLPENFESINAIILLLQKYQQRQVHHG
ncbi:MAG: acyl carrier protein [Desulfobacteraceae bacterium]|nr:MAG: acyl carrier protein [Desulfobacteraceae bacterium]